MNRILAAGALVFFLWGNPDLFSQAQKPPETIDYEKRLDQVRRDVEILKGKLREEEKRELTVLSRLDRLGINRNLIRNELRLLTLQLDKNRRDLDAARASIPPMEERLAQKRTDLARVLVTLYKFGRLSFVRYILQAPDLRTMASESRKLGALASSQDRMIASFAADLSALNGAVQSLAAKQKEIASLAGRASAKKAELDREEQKERTLVAQIRADRKTHELALSELARRAQELQTMIQRLESRPMTPPFAMTPLQENKGRLPWPTPGRVIQGFGPQVHPQFNTVTRNNGIEIAPPSGDLTVRAVHAGRVAYADHFPAYGNLLIIDHGGTDFSLYGHLAEFLVKTGEYVLAGQPVAVAGDTASLLGISLYFEIREQTRPVDPLQWLSRR